MRNFKFKNRYLKPFLRKVLVLVLFLSFNSFSSHKYYASITKVEVDNSENLLKAYTVLFVDDTEQLLKERYDLQVADFNNLNFEEKEILSRYLNSKVSFSVNRKPLNVKFLGTQLESQQLYLYYEASFQENPQRLDLKNELLMDLYDDQHNTVDVIFGNTVKSVHLNSQNRKATLYY